MTNDDLDALLALSLSEIPRLPDIGFVDHNRKRVVLQALLVRETKGAIRRGLRDLVVATGLIVMLVAWVALIGDSVVGMALPLPLPLPLLVICFWAMGQDWSFPDLSFNGDRRPEEGNAYREDDGSALI